MNDNEFEFDPSIDKNCLDDEWIEQPVKVLKINKLLAEAERKRDQVKLQLELLEAELDKIIRSESSSRTTEASVKNAIRARPEYQKKSNELIEANYELKSLIGLSNAFSQRKSALEHLSRLWMSDYFATPYNPQIENEIIDRQIEKQNSKLTQSMLRRRKKNEEEV